MAGPVPEVHPPTRSPAYDHASHPLHCVRCAASPAASALGPGPPAAGFGPVAEGHTPGTQRLPGFGGGGPGDPRALRDDAPGTPRRKGRGPTRLAGGGRGPGRAGQHQLPGRTLWAIEAPASRHAQLHPGRQLLMRRTAAMAMPTPCGLPQPFPLCCIVTNHQFSEVRLPCSESG